MAISISPLAPEKLPDLPLIAGVEIATAEAGIKYKNRTDVLLMRFAESTQVAGVFTKSLAPSAAIDWCKQSMANCGGSARALLVNSGNANAFTGKRGIASVNACADFIAEQFMTPKNQIFLASTGVIGEPLDAQKIGNVMPKLASSLAPNLWHKAAEAIMTTDTFAKAATRSINIGDNKITINGIAKGSGMIAPDMATMLGFIVTDAAINADILQKMLQIACAKSFNSITVDGDTSTSDTCLLFATGKAQNAVINDVNSEDAQKFLHALTDLMIELAQLIARDGEGAQKFIDITVTGAVSDESAHKIGLSIANSPLIKTAIAGEDANWGRIVMAVGKSGQQVDRDKLKIAIGGVTIAQNGERVEGYNEAPVTEHMRGRNIVINVDIGIGNGKWQVWSCDLTHGYIAINADYRS